LLNTHTVSQNDVGQNTHCDLIYCVDLYKSTLSSPLGYYHECWSI